VNDRDLEAAARELGTRRGRAREATIGAVACAVLAAGAPIVSTSAAVALAAGAATAALLAAAQRGARRDAIARLALDSAAYALPEVRRYGARLVVPAERARLAAWMREIVRDSHVPGNWYLGDRVLRHAGQLESLAADLLAAQVRVRPASVVACHRLLTHAAESPLYNPDVPADELPAAIERIRRGIRPLA
jgi:hypothetical protein